MPTAASPMSGAVSTSATAAHTTSNRRFTMMQCAANGHEDFSGLEALLISPGQRLVAQRVEGPRMGIVAQLARVTGHRRELDVERRGGVYPRIGDERPRKRPLGTARGIEGVHGAHPARGGPRRDERRLKQQVMIAIDVAAELAIDDL